MYYRPMHSVIYDTLFNRSQPIMQFCDRFPCFASQDKAHHTAHNIIHVSMESAIFNDHHGTPTAFLMNFTKPVKLTKTLIAYHYWRWNSFSCDYFKKSWKLLESGFPDRYFGRSMLDCKPYCEQSSHRYVLHCNAWDLHGELPTASEPSYLHVHVRIW